MPFRSPLGGRHFDNEADAADYADIINSQEFGYLSMVSQDPAIRKMAADEGVGLDKLKDDEDREVRLMAAKRAKDPESLKYMANDKDPKVKEVLVEKEYYSDSYNPKDSPAVKAALAEKGIHLDRHINDPDPKVRQALAKKGISLERFAVDKDPKVRLEVAKKGKFLHLLSKAPDEEVRSTSIRFLKEKE